MPIRFAGARAVFEGHCTVEEAHDLAEWLLAGRARKVDLTGCTGFHTAVLQCLMALRPEVVAGPADAGLARWLAAALPVASEPPSPKPRRPRGKPAAQRRSAAKA